MTKTLHTALFVVVVLTYTTCQTPIVKAQSFANCYQPIDDPDVTVCSWSDSPLTFNDGTSLADSTLVTSCDTGASFTTYNCDCFIYIEDGTGVFDSNNYCNSCSLLSISATSFSIHWDCSNRLVGRCPIFDSNGCQTGDDPTPFPTASPIINFPTNPSVDYPTPFPVAAPIDFPTDPPVDDPTPFPAGQQGEQVAVDIGVEVEVDDQKTKEASKGNKANVQAKSLKCNRRTLLQLKKLPTPPKKSTAQNDNTPASKKDGDIDSQTTHCAGITSDGYINQYYYAVGMSSFAITIISMVFRF